MPMVAKLIIIILLNIAGLAWLILSLFKLQHDPVEALAVTWRAIIAGGSGNPKETADLPNGAAILKKTWWLMVGAILWGWLTQPDIAYSCLGALLIIGHLGWYLIAQTSVPLNQDRIIELNSQWGVAYVAVRPNSGWTAKTLSELDLRKKNLLVLAIERQRQTIHFPKGLEVLLPGDRLVIFGDLNYYRGLGN